MTTAWGIVAGLLAAAIWSGWYVLARHGVTAGGLDPYDLAALRFMVAAPLLMLALRRFPFPRGKVALALIMAIGVGPAFVIVIGTGFLHAPAKFGGAMSAVSGVLLTLIAARLLLREPLAGRQISGIAIASAGLVLLTLMADEKGAIWPFLVGGVLWAAYGIAFRRSGLTSLEAVTTVALISAVVYLPIYFLFTGARLWQAAPSQLLLQAVGQGVLTGIVALWMHARAVAALGATKGALFQSLVPALTVGLSFLFLGERPAIIEVAAILVILGGVILALSPAGAVERRAR